MLLSFCETTASISFSFHSKTVVLYSACFLVEFVERKNSNCENNFFSLAHVKQQMNVTINFSQTLTKKAIEISHSIFFNTYNDDKKVSSEMHTSSEVYTLSSLT